MKNISVTKLVFLIIILSLCVFTWFYIFSWAEDKTGIIVAFTSIAMTITNYYFKDKKIKEEKVDSLVEEPEQEPKSDL